MIKVREFWKDAVLQGKKTRSYRPWKRPFRVGSLHECKAGRFEPGFAWVEITRVWKQPLGDVTEQDARNNGYPTRREMLEHFCLTYAKERAMGKPSAWWKETLQQVLDRTDAGPDVWCMEFRVVDPPEKKGRGRKG